MHLISSILLLNFCLLLLDLHVNLINHLVLLFNCHILIERRIILWVLFLILLILGNILLHLLLHLLIGFILLLLLIFTVVIFVVVLFSLLYEPHLFLYSFFLCHAIGWLIYPRPLWLFPRTLLANFLGYELLRFRVTKVIQDVILLVECRIVIVNAEARALSSFGFAS